MNTDKIKRIFAIFLSSTVLFACASPTKKTVYMDKDFPGLTPKIYAPDAFSLPDRFEHGLTFRKGGTEHYFMLAGGKVWKYKKIMRHTLSDNGQAKLEAINFTDHIPRKNNGIIGGEPIFSLDEKTLYFVADYPTDIWQVKLDNNGNWGTPTKLGPEINSRYSEWFPTIAPDNHLYFSRTIKKIAKIYKAELIDDEYKKVTPLDAKFNYDCGDQVFSKKMDYIIFTSPRKGGHGELDLYVAFKKTNNEWTDGINLGPEINTKGFEFGPFISPDNRFLFFTRRDRFNKATSSDVYWVSLDIIEQLREQAL